MSLRSLSSILPDGGFDVAQPRPASAKLFSKLVGIAVDIGCRRRGQSDVKRIEVGQRGLPGAVDGTVTLVGNHDVEVATRQFGIAANHRLQQADSDLLLLHGHSRLQPVAAVLGAKVLQRRDSLLGQLFTIDQEQETFCAARFEHPLRVQTDDVRLPGARRQFDQEPALAKFDGMIQRA